MKTFILQLATILTLFAMLCLLAIGCAQPSSETRGDSAASSEAAQDHETQDAGDHSGWWCVKHGVPEAECAQCDASLIAQFKQNGDWCDEHDRPESQCFLCDTTRFDKLAARYEAKFGKRPPKPTD